MINKFSIIIPTYNNIDSLESIFENLIKNLIYINEIIIIDSSEEKRVYEYIHKLDIDLIKYHKVNKSYPGKARNIGVKHAKSKWVAFLDSKTIPNEDWLSFLSKKVNLEYEIVFGSVKYLAKSKFQKNLKASSYGDINHTCVPGTAIIKEIFLDNIFLENVLAGEDIVWKQQILDQGYKIKIPSQNTITYNKLPNNYFNLLQKYFIYSYHASKLNIFSSIKTAYLAIFLLFIYFNYPRKSFLNQEISNIKSLILNVVLILFAIILFNYLKLKLKKIYLKIFLPSIFLIFVYFNQEIIHSSVIKISTFFSFSNVIFIFLLATLSMITRGIILPTFRNEKIPNLIPLKWLKIGFVGLLLDLIKAPSYIVGSGLILFNLVTFNFFISNRYLFKSKRKKILFVCPYPFDQQAGQRLKYEQHLNYFKKNGFDYTIKSFMNNDFWQIVYLKKFYFKKIYYTIVGYINRIKLIFTLYKYDYVYIFLWVTPFGGYFFEYIYRLFSKKIIYDVEDNIFINVPNEINLYVNYLKFKNKYIYLIKKSDFIITSSPQLKIICDDHNRKKNNNKSLFIPPSINLKKYWPLKKISNDNVLTIGWTGTFSSQEYLTSLTSVFNLLLPKINFKILIISNNKFSFDNIDTEFIKWNKPNEIKDLLKIDIGLYPLNYDPWVEGKSGLKAMQYMSLGIPTIATNIGQAMNIIDNKKDGFLVNNDDEWVNAILMLYNDPSLRLKIGLNARKKIEKLFSFDQISNKYLNIFKNL